ncbi:MAG TPA: uridine kinase [Acidobacteriaceae bacterium]
MNLEPEPEQQLSLRMQRPAIFGIAGCSGSGKTTLARELATHFNATLFPLDFYYRDLAHLTLEERKQVNYDHPDSVENELLTRHVSELAQGQSIDRPVYDFAQYTRVPGKTEHITPDSVVIVEGILALHYEELRALYDFSIYVDCPEDICFTRRLARDVAERGRTPELVKAQYEATAKPMARKFVMPSQQYATVTVDATGSIDWSVEQVLQRLRSNGLLQVLRP